MVIYRQMAQGYKFIQKERPPLEVLPPEETQLQIVPMPTVSTAPGKAKKPVLLEKEKHKAMLAFYFALGKDRILAKVGEHFGVKQSLVEKYSHLFDFKEPDTDDIVLVDMNDKHLLLSYKKLKFSLNVIKFKKLLLRAKSVD